MLYDSSQLLNIINTANAYCSSFYPSLRNMGANSGNPFGAFNNVAALNIKINPINFGSNVSSPSSFGSGSTQLGGSLNRGRITLGQSTPSCLEAVRLAEAELDKGVREIGSSNDSVDIRKYKNGAKNDAQWCGYFSSWLYGAGQGTSNNSTFGFTGSTQAIKSQAIDAGHYAFKNTGYTPKVGDLAMWTKSASSGHVGIVTKVYSDGSFDVIEGNSGNKVAKHHYASQDSVGSTFNGFVKMNEWTA